MFGTPVVEIRPPAPEPEKYRIANAFGMYFIEERHGSQYKVVAVRSNLAEAELALAQIKEIRCVP